MDKSIERRLGAIGLRASDVDERFVLGAGHGGQKLQKTSSCVWLRHRPTGVEARCQTQRSQSANRELAWADLCEKLEKLRRAEEARKRDEWERDRRRNRQKSHGQKARMVDSKRHRAAIKSGRGKPVDG
jgi:protein subunit release factor B